MRSLLLDLFDTIRFRCRRGPSRRELAEDIVNLRRKLDITDEWVSNLVVDVTMLQAFPSLRGRDQHGQPRRRLASVTPIRQAVEQ